MMKQKWEYDASSCKIAKNLAKCFIYEGSINLWCKFWTLEYKDGDPGSVANTKSK